MNRRARLLLSEYTPFALLVLIACANGRVEGEYYPGEIADSDAEAVSGVGGAVAGTVTTGQTGITAADSANNANATTQAAAPSSTTGASVTATGAPTTPAASAADSGGSGGSGTTGDSTDGQGTGGEPFGGFGSTSDGNGTGGNATAETTTGGDSSTTGPGNTDCSGVSGDAGTVNQTIVVGSGETFDGECQRYRAGSSLGNGSQDESQLPVFELEPNSRLINVVLGAPAADGIHTYGNVELENIVWEDVGEDALTIKESGTVVLTNGSAVDGEDKIFQINAASTFRLSNFTARNAGKLIRQNGGTTFRVDVYIDNCDVSNMSESIFRTDSGSSTVSMTNTRYSNIGDALFIGVSNGNITQSNNTEY